MPIIGKVGRKTLKVRALSLIIHIVLLLGAVTMIYPFMVMISASFKSNVDAQTFSVYPQFFFDDEMLYRKYIEARMNELGDRMAEQYKNRALSFTLLDSPAKLILQVHDDWFEFLEENYRKHDIFDYYISEQYGRGIYPRNERKFRNYMKKKTGGSLDRLNEQYGTSTLNWDEVRLEETGITGRNFNGDYTGFLAEYSDFRHDLPLWQRVYVSLDGNFINSELRPLFKNEIRLMNDSLQTNFMNWEEIKLAETMPDGALQPFWINYVKQRLNIHHIQLLPEALASWQGYIQEKYDDISLLNKTWITDYPQFSSIQIPVELPRSGALPVDYTFFIENIAQPQWLKVTSVELDYRGWLADKYGDVDDLNIAFERGYSEFKEVELPLTNPEFNLAKEEDWSWFVRQEVYPWSIRLKPLSQQEFLTFMRKLHPGKDGSIDLDSFNREYNTDYEQEIFIYPPLALPENFNYRMDWLYFVRNVTSNRFLEVTPDKQGEWISYLESKYHNTRDLNQAWHLSWQDFNQVSIDHYQIDYNIFKEHKTSIFWEFAKRNYVMVLDEMLYNGRAMLNTIIYCLLAIISALIVNPLAAYAMSRYKLPATYKIILVLMLTMAFPAMVMGIPNFLIMKKFGMLNTFWALILPGLADGYFIFLLKGFFDSLPKELFESATLDGASEWTIFWRIAMSLSKPIMAVIALSAFNAAYRNFMFAFIVCQDKSMWTMMVNIYQMMQRTSAGVGFAALVVASIPTFAVFVFFQNIIIRGIVVPTEK
ncbi:MAG: ABC transporter permease subunit [Candidatus Cloacimonetes bacterium]|nr:ABC transporter permease subunit [Candidatus Cloacimonadota bacterium]